MFFLDYLIGMGDAPTDHKFWNTQPVIQTGEVVKENGVIDSKNDVNAVQKDPIPLPPEFVWSVVDTRDKDQQNELYTFLANHYVAHKNSVFAFAYSAEFLDWALHPPGWKPQWHLGIRLASDNSLIGFISATPISILVDKKVNDIVAVDFLSVHKEYRQHSFAPLLISEVTRRVNLEGIFTAIFTAGKQIIKPFATSIYYHHIINSEKLTAIGFTYQKKPTFLNKFSIKLPGFREMTEADVPAVTEKLNEYANRYTVSQVFSEAEVAHMFLPRKNIVGSYVVQKGKKIDSFFSFYIVPSTVKGHPVYKEYISAYVYYYACPLGQLSDVAKCAMYMAKKDYGADVFNCLKVLRNDLFIKSCDFVNGDGHLNYYFYNYACKPMDSSQCGVVLL